MSVGLPHDVKGTHMSRFVKILEDQKRFYLLKIFIISLRTPKYFRLDSAYISLILHTLKRKQPGFEVESLLDYAVNFTCEIK